jgi:hypothetical protein
MMLVRIESGQYEFAKILQWSASQEGLEASVQDSLPKTDDARRAFILAPTGAIVILFYLTAKH